MGASKYLSNQTSFRAILRDVKKELGGGNKQQLESKCFWKEKKNTKNTVKNCFGGNGAVNYLLILIFRWESWNLTSTKSEG